MYTAFSPLTRNHTQKPSRRGRGEGHKRTAVGGPFCCVCFRREKMHRVGRTLCLMIQYPIIFTELCVSCEQFVNDPHQRYFFQKRPGTFSKILLIFQKSPPTFPQMRIVCGIISAASTLGESGRTRCRSLERYLYPAVSRPGTQQNGTGSTVICTSGSPPPPSRHSGCYIHFPRGP